MKIGIVAVMAVCIVGLTWYMYRLTPPTSIVLDGAMTIILTQNGFDPDVITIKKGTTITFKTTTDLSFWPASNLHPDHTIYSAFDPKHPIRPDESWSFVFEKVGTWGFHDHLRSYFVGKIQVLE